MINNRSILLGVLVVLISLCLLGCSKAQNKSTSREHNITDQKNESEKVHNATNDELIWPDSSNPGSVIEIRIDKKAALAVGVSHSKIAQVIKGFMRENPSASRANIDSLDFITVNLPNGTQVPIKNFVTLHMRLMEKE